MSCVHLPSFVLGRIQPLANGNYQPSDDGQLAIVLGVYDRFNELVDCVAWLPDDPGHWWPRHGDETPLLGARVLAFAADCNQPVNLLPTPEQWLLAYSKPNSHGIVCIFDWGMDFGPLFEGVSRVECNSPELQKRLRWAFRAWEPPITAPRQGAPRVA